MSPFLHDRCGKGHVTLSLLSLRCDTVPTHVDVTNPRALPLRGHQPSRGPSHVWVSPSLCSDIPSSSGYHAVPTVATCPWVSPCPRVPVDAQNPSPQHSSYPGVGTLSGGTALPPAPCPSCRPPPPPGRLAALASRSKSQLCVLQPGPRLAHDFN